MGMCLSLVGRKRCRWSVKWVCVWLGVGGLVLGFTNPIGTGGVWDLCLYLSCGGVGGFGRVGW